MGLTLADADKLFYEDCLDRGLNLEEMIELVPEHRREQFKKNVGKTFCESHYGMKDWVMALIIAVVVIGSLVWALNI